MVNVPTSTMVITVSRCIWARVRFISTATIWFTVPPANSRLASLSMPCEVVRSETPTRTAPLPMIWTSPPSTVAGPACVPSDHTGKSEPAKRGCQR